MAVTGELHVRAQSPPLATHTHSHLHFTIIVTIRVYFHHLWTGVVRDILGSLILKFPREPAVYRHFPWSRCRPKKEDLVAEDEKSRRAPVQGPAASLLVKTVLSSPGLLTGLHQGREDWRKKCLALLATLTHMLLTIQKWKLPVQQDLQQSSLSLVAC